MSGNHSPACSCPKCAPSAHDEEMRAAIENMVFLPGVFYPDQDNAAYKSDYCIAELIPGSRGRIKWKWVNKKSPIRPFLARLLNGRSAHSKAYYRLVEFPNRGSRGGNTTANKAADDALRVRYLADKLRTNHLVAEHKITTEVLKRWYLEYPNTKCPSRRTISRNLTGK